MQEERGPHRERGAMQEERGTACDIKALVPLLEMRNRIGFVYGSEEIAMLFYALIRREQPRNILELGTGLGVTAFWMAQALKEIGAGHLWTIDDGSHWQDRAKFEAAITPLVDVEPFDALDPAGLDLPGFINAAAVLLGVSEQMTFTQGHVDITKEEQFTADKYPCLAEPLDFVFLDISRTPDDILDTLHVLLPHLADSASIFIDSASTSLSSYLFLEKLIDQLNHSKVPRRFLLGQSPERRRALVDLVAQRRFTLVHLVERLKRAQNSTAWIKVEPNDYVPHPQTLMKWV